MSNLSIPAKRNLKISVSWSIYLENLNKINTDVSPEATTSYAKSIVNYATIINTKCTEEDPNTKRFKRILIYYDTDTKYAIFGGNFLRQATIRHLNNS